MFLTDWKMTYEGHKDLSCSAPCTMYSVLLENGIIDDPFYGENEKNLIELADKGCVFECEFDVDSKMLEKEHVEITFLGLDTICSIALNDVVIGDVKKVTELISGQLKVSYQLCLEKFLQGGKLLMFLIRQQAGQKTPFILMVVLLGNFK